MSQKNKLGDVLYQFSKTRRFKLLLFGVLTFLFLWFIFSLRVIFVPVLIGGVIAYILEPLVRLVRKTGISRLTAILIIYVSMVFVVTLTLTATSFGLTRQVQQLSNAVEEDVVDKNDPTILLVDHNGNGRYDMGYRLRLQEQLERNLEKWNHKYPSFNIQPEIVKDVVVESFQPTEESDSSQKKDFHFLKWLMKNVTASTGDIVAFVLMFIMIPIYAFLLQRLVPQMNERIPELIPQVFRAKTLSIFSKINLELSAFFRGKLLVCFVKGFMTWIALFMIDVNYAFFIGFLAGALSIIPYLGAVIGFLLAFLLTVLDKGTDPLLSITVVFVVMEIVEFGLHILVFGKEVGVHPLAFILALFVGGSLFGVFGVIMAVPLLSVATILWKEFVAPLIAELSAPGEVQEVKEIRSEEE